MTRLAVLILALLACGCQPRHDLPPVVAGRGDVMQPCNLWCSSNGHGVIIKDAP